MAVLLLTVTDPAGRRHQVIGRAAKVVLAVLARADKINRGKPGSLTFALGLHEVVKVRWTEDGEDWEP